MTNSQASLGDGTLELLRVTGVNSSDRNRESQSKLNLKAQWQVLKHGRICPVTFLPAAIALCFIVPFHQTKAASPVVPGWFSDDSAGPFAIYQAWTNLSMKESSICRGSDW